MNDRRILFYRVATSPMMNFIKDKNKAIILGSPRIYGVLLILEEEIWRIFWI